MIIKAWRTAKCINIDEVEVESISIAPDDRDEALECIENEWEPMISVELKDGRWISYPVRFVIEIREA